MQEADVHRIIKTPAVLRAFELAKLVNLPKEAKVIYDAIDPDDDNDTV